MTNSPRHYRVLEPNESYTFSKYFELPYTPEEILSDLGCKLLKAPLQISPYGEAIPNLPTLSDEIERNLRLVNLLSETARREAIVAPILLAVCEHLQTKLNIEYAVKVNDWLKGTLDYYIEEASGLLVIEAKQSDLTRGFVQLATELIALDQWTQSSAPVFYGAVTTGELWKFGTLNRRQRTIIEDFTLYQVPRNLEDLVRLMIAMISPEVHTG